MLTTTTMFQGNLTAEPKPRFTNGGTAVADFRVLVNRRVKEGETWVDGEPTPTTWSAGQVAIGSLAVSTPWRGAEQCDDDQGGTPSRRNWMA